MSIIALSGPTGAGGEITVEVGAAAVNMRQDPVFANRRSARAKAASLVFDPVAGWLQIPLDRTPGRKGWTIGNVEGKLAFQSIISLVK